MAAALALAVALGAAPACDGGADCAGTKTAAEPVVVRSRDAALRARVTADGKPVPGRVRFVVWMGEGRDPYVTQGQAATDAEGVAAYPLQSDIDFSFTRAQLEKATHYEAVYDDKAQPEFCSSKDEASFRWEGA